MNNILWEKYANSLTLPVLNYRLSIFILVIMCISMNAHAVIDDAPTFASAEQQAQYSELINVVRCPTCQNQNIAESNAALARQLRALVAEQIADGKSNKEIVQFLTERYGDFITYNPPFQANTWILWLGPLVIMSTMILIWLVWRRGKYSPTLSADQQQALNTMLEQYRDKS